MSSYPSSITWSSPSTSVMVATALMLSFLTRPINDQDLTQSSVHVDWAKRWLRTWDRMRRPRLKMCSTSTDVATVCVNISVIITYKKKNLTRYCKIIQSHTREMGECVTALMPPEQGVVDIFNISCKVGIKFILHNTLLGLSECGQAVKNIFKVSLGTSQSATSIWVCSHTWWALAESSPSFRALSGGILWDR